VQVAFVCPACRATINAPPSLEGESYPCPKCKADVDRWPSPVSSPATVRVVPQPPPIEKADWYYSVNEARRGPVTIAQLKSLVEGAALRPNDLVWREGMPSWVEAGTIPELFPASTLVKPTPPPQPEAEPDDEDDRPRRDNGRVVQVNVQQVIEGDEERRPRRRREGFRCPYCDSPERPIVRRQVSGAGWAVFVLLLIFTIIFCFIGLFIQEDVRYCRDCGARL
jgi:hypothetical protein